MGGKLEKASDIRYTLSRSGNERGRGGWARLRGWHRVGGASGRVGHARGADPEFGKRSAERRTLHSKSDSLNVE
eukprot:2696050-Pleurochrysis_carterae.AAC.1